VACTVSKPARRVVMLRTVDRRAWLQLSPRLKPPRVLGMPTRLGYMHNPLWVTSIQGIGPQSPRNSLCTCQQSPHTCNKNINKLEYSWIYYSNSVYSIFQLVARVTSPRNQFWHILWPISKEIAPRNRLTPTHRLLKDILGSNKFVHDPLELLEYYPQGFSPCCVTMWAKMGPKALPRPTKLPWATPEVFHRYLKGLLTAQIMIPQLYNTI
jgi:hypothetical protein